MSQSITSRVVTGLAVFSTVVLPAVAAAENSAAKKDVPSESRIRELISQLGSDDFATREAAGKELRAIGEQLLFDPELRDVEDFSNLDRFHDCFIVPLDEARKSDDIEVQQRARKLYSQFSPEHPIGKGPDGWAISAIYRLIHDVPKPLSYQDFKKRGIRRPPLRTREQRELNRKRELLHENFDRLRIRKMAMDNSERTASLIMAGELKVTYRPSALAIVLTEWAHHDFEAALKFALDFERQFGRDQSILLHAALMSVWPDDYPLDEAIRSLKRFDMDALDYSAGMMNQVRRWAREDADAALQWAESLKSRNHRNIAVNLIVQALAEQGLRRGEKEIPKLSDQSLRDIARSALVAVLERQGKIANPVLIDSIKHSELRSLAQAASVRVLAKTDHRAAMKAMENLDDPSVSWTCFGAIAKRWYSVDPQGCLAYIEKIEHDSTHDQWIGATGITRKARDINAVKKLPLRKASSRKRVVISIAHEISKTDAPSALKIISEYSGVQQMDPGFGDGYGIPAVLHNWVKYEPRSAMNWLTGHPSYVRRCIPPLIAEWARHQPIEACRWMLSQRNTKESLHTFFAFAETVIAMRSDDS